jgi:hypothetical protein
MEGRAGTIVLEDTRGFHAGVTLKSGYRQLMQWEFASSNYRYTRDSWNEENICMSRVSEEMRRKMLVYPRMFERFKIDSTC